MSRLVVRVKPLSGGLTTLNAVNDMLGFTTGDNVGRDAFLQARIDEASDAVLEAAARLDTFARAQVMEPIDGTGSTEALLSLTPIVQVECVTLFADPLPQDARDNTMDDPIDYRVDDPDAGVLVCDSGWGNSHPQALWLERYELPTVARRDYRAVYWGGYLLPSDDLLASGIAVTAAGSRIAWPSGQPAPLLCSGERVRMTGFVGGNNRGWKTVLQRDDTGITVLEALTDETGPAASVVQVRTIPLFWERYALDTVKSLWMNRVINPRLSSEKLADWSSNYAIGRNAGTDVAGILPPDVLADVERRMRRFA